MKILFTKTAGFIDSKLAGKLAKHGNEVGYHPIVLLHEGITNL